MPVSVLRRIGSARVEGERERGRYRCTRQEADRRQQRHHDREQRQDGMVWITLAPPSAAAASRGRREAAMPSGSDRASASPRPASASWRCAAARPRQLGQRLVHAGRPAQALDRRALPARRRRAAPPRARRPGRAAARRGVPSCTMRPASITAMRSASSSASAMSWRHEQHGERRARGAAARRTAAGGRACPDRARRRARRAAAARGSAASARASPTRCAWPPESACGKRSRNAAGSSSTRSSSASTRARDARALPAEQRRRDAHVLGHVRCGNSPTCWNA